MDIERADGADSAAAHDVEAARIQELIDFQAARLNVDVLGDDAIDELLRTSRRIAVIGASSKAHRASNGVLRFLVRAGYDVVPVHPNEKVVAGLECYRTLGEAVAATGPVDIVGVFRRAQFCPEHAHEAVALGARCPWPP